MTKQVQATMAALMVLSTITVRAQLSTTTTTTKTSPSTTKTTVTTTDKSASSSKRRSTKRTARKAPVESATARELRELREQMVNQQAQIDGLKQELVDKDKRIADATADAAAANSSAVQANQQAATLQQTIQQSQTQIDTLNSDISDMKLANTGLANTLVTTTHDLNEKIESPSVLHYKGVTIQPIGFVAFEGVWRQRSLNSDINTPFNSIPFPSANEGHTSELNFSGRQSRLGALIQGNTGKFNLTGYYEADWLGTGTSSNNNQSNSYVFRQRQIWGQVASKTGFAMTGGQMWSLVTEDRKGTDARTEIQPSTIDSQYLVGYNWTRQPEIRVQQRFGNYNHNALTVAMALEQAQITSFTVNGTAPNQYFFGGQGANGGLYNAAAASASGTTTCTSNGATPPVLTCTTTVATSDITTYANNATPDVIFKAAYDNPHLHFEFGGLARFLRNQYFPVTGYNGTAAAPTYTYGTQYVKNISAAGGGFGSIRGYIGKPGSYPAIEIGIQGMAGTGVGRYGSSQLADATLRPDQKLEPIRNYHGLGSLEVHLSPKFDVFSYYGGEYAQRTFYRLPQGNLIGYAPPNLSNAGCYNLPGGPVTTIGNGGSTGSDGPSTCAAPTKYIQEGMIGFQWRPITSAKYGRLQYSATYSLLQRQLWAGIGSASTPVSPRAQDNMIHVQMRYYIP